jgi:glycerophosphoryl diester phosphodiesterase
MAAVRSRAHRQLPESRPSSRRPRPNRRIATGALLVALTAGSAIAVAPPAHAADAVEIIGHRGGTDWGTENSLRTVKRALALGADAIEIDLQWTKDRRTVIMHDDTVNRTSNCSGTVVRMTYAKFRSCKLNDGTRPPNVYDMLNAIGDAGEHVYLHVRGMDTSAKVRDVVRALNKYGMNNRRDATVISTNRKYLSLAKKYGMRAARGYLFDSSKGWAEDYSVLLPYDTAVSRTKVAQAQRGGHKVVVIEGHPTRIGQVLGLGLDGFMANGLAEAMQELDG